MRAAVVAVVLSLPLLSPACLAAAGDATRAEPLLEAGALYVADALSNVSGGLREGSAWVDYLELAVGFDAGRYFDVGNLGVYASLVRTNAPTFSDRYVGDAMVVSSIDSGRSLRVLEAWLDWQFEAWTSGSLRLGLYDLNSEFDTTESRGLFLNSAYGMGQELAQTGRNGPSVFPITALAARVAWTPHERWLLKMAIVDGVPGDPGNHHRARWHLSRSEGALCIAELTTRAGPLAQLSLGHWQYTGRFAGLRPSDTGDDDRLERDNRGSYVTAEFASPDAPRDGAPAWSGFVRAGQAAERVNAFERHIAAGLMVDWPWPTSRRSRLGLAVAEARIGTDHRAAQRSNGTRVERYERNVELTWRVPLGEHAVLQPDLQYVINPGANRTTPDAWIVGLRVELAVQR